VFTKWKTERLFQNNSFFDSTSLNLKVSVFILETGLLVRSQSFNGIGNSCFYSLETNGN
jgi:hypothetical protein